jgi:hypothetical protein
VLSLLIDDKTTGNASYSLKRDDFRKIRTQAFQARRRPAMSVHFENEGLRLFVIDEIDFHRLMETYE